MQIDNDRQQCARASDGMRMKEKKDIVRYEPGDEWGISRKENGIIYAQVQGKKPGEMQKRNTRAL
jgi:hypothetical protein